MNRRVLLGMSAAFATGAMQTRAIGQDAAAPSADELKATLQDDDHFAQLMTEMWVLRDLLALQQGTNISAQSTDFQGLQDQLRSHRTSITNTISTEPALVNLPEDLLSSANSIAANEL